MLILGSILTVILSGVVAAFVSALLSVSKDQLIFRQRKAEELFLAFDHWDKHASSAFLMYYPYLQGKLSISQVQNLIIKSQERSPDLGRDHAEIFMLTQFYFPELESPLLQFDSARAGLVKEINAIENGTCDPQRFDAAVRAFDKASKQFKECIIKRGKSYSDLEIFGEAKRSLRRALAAFRKK